MKNSQKIIILIIGLQVHICKPQWSRYRHNNRLALRLVDWQDFTPVANASINLVDVPMNEDEMAINHDFADEVELALVEAGICYMHHREVAPRGAHCNFKIVRLCKLPNSLP